MASFAYKLLVDRYKTVEPSEWLQALSRGDLLLVDPNEVGKSGPLLHALLSHNDAPQLQAAWSQEAADLFFPDPMAERLLMHLIALGANPWVKDEQERDALDWAVYLGFPKLFSSLIQHPQAPPVASIRERTSQGKTRVGSGPLPWVVMAAGRNQEELLKALHEVGFDVNATDKRGLPPLAHAPTAQMVSQLAGLGADLSWRTGAQVQWITPGLDLPSFWGQHSHFSGTDLVKLQSAWRKHASAQGVVQPEAMAPLSHRLDTLASTITKFPYPAKAVVLEQVKQLALKKPWVDENSVSLMDRLVAAFEKSQTVAPVRASVLEWALSQDPQGEARHLDSLFGYALKTGEKGRVGESFIGCVGRWVQQLADRSPEGLALCFQRASANQVRTVEVLKRWLQAPQASVDYSVKGFYPLDSPVAMELQPFVEAFCAKDGRGLAQGWAWFMGDMRRAGAEGEKNSLWQTVFMLLPDDALVQGVGLLEAVNAVEVGVKKTSSQLSTADLALHTTFWAPSLERARSLGAWGGHSAYADEAMEIFARRVSTEAVMEKRVLIMESSLKHALPDDSVTVPAAPRF